MPTSLVKADWIITASGAYGDILDTSPETNGTKSLGITVAVGATTFEAILNKLRCSGGTLTFWTKISTPASGDSLEFNAVVKRVNSSAPAQDNHSFSIDASGEALTITNGFQYSLAPAANTVHKINISGNGVYENSIYSYITKTPIYIDSGYVGDPGFTKFRATYFDDNDFSRIIVEWYNNGDWDLVIELYDQNSRSTSNLGVPGHIGFGSICDSTAGGDTMVFSAIRHSNIYDEDISRAKAGLVQMNLGNSTGKNGNLIISKPSAITAAIGSITGPDSSPINALTLTTGGAAQTVELFLPVYAFKNAILELYYKKSTPEIDFFYNLRQEQHGASNFYNLKAAVSGAGASVFSLNRVESGTTLIPITTSVTGPTHTAAVWIGHKVSIYDTTSFGLVKPRVSLEYNIINGATTYHSYTTLFDTIDNIVGPTTEPSDLTNKIGLYSVVINIPASSSISIGELNLYEI